MECAGRGSPVGSPFVVITLVFVIPTLDTERSEVETGGICCPVPESAPAPATLPLPVLADSSGLKSARPE